ncbi:sulfatase [Halobacteriales archaeon Cl-PHB]
MTGRTDAGPTGTVLVTVDSLRADVLGPTVTPTLDSLAERASDFEQAFAHGNWTPFAFPSILGSAPVFTDGPGVGLAESPSLAETLSEAGVRTAGYNAANGFLTAYWGYDRGFDEFESFIDDGGSRSSKYLAAHPTVAGWLQLAASPFRRAVNTVRRRETKPFVDVSHGWDVEQRATAFLEDVDEPFFCWVHYMDAHTPYVPAPKHVQAVDADQMNLLTRLRAHVHTGLGWDVGAETLAALRSLYRGTVHQIDASIGRLLKTLEATGLRDSTTVVVTGDHGEEFQDHGHLAHYPKLYDELVRVPLLVDDPGAPAREVTSPVGHQAVPATVCDAMGVEPEHFDGEGLLPTVRDGEPLDREPVTSVAVRGETVTQQPIPRRLDEGDVLVSARTARYTYIYYTESGDRELYDRTTDPGEQTDLVAADEAPEATIDRLHDAVESRLARLHDEADAKADADDPETSDAVNRQLEALGYR